MPDRAGQHRPALDAELRDARGRSAIKPSATAARSSPAPATIRSSSTWARSSIWPVCGRSTRRTSSPSPTAPVIDGVAGYNTSTRSPSRSRSPATDSRRPARRSRSSVSGRARAARPGSSTRREASRARAAGSRSRASATRSSTRSSSRATSRTTGTASRRANDSQFQTLLREARAGRPHEPAVRLGPPAGRTTGRTDLTLILLKGVPGVNAIGSTPRHGRHAPREHGHHPARQRGLLPPGPRTAGLDTAEPDGRPRWRPVRLPERASSRG